MGIYDRDYERGYGNSSSYGGGGYGGGGGWQPPGQGSGIQLRWPTTVVGWILLINLAVYVIELFFGQEVTTPQGQFYTNKLIDLFHLDAFWYQQPWRVYGLLTYGFLHDPHNLMHIAGNMFGFWLFGRELERRFGSIEFLLFYLGGILVGGFAFSLSQSLMGQPGTSIGASAGVTAVIILFALLYPHVRILFMLVIPMPMWVLGVIIIAGDMFGSLGGSDANIAFAAHLGGAAFALLYHFQHWRLSSWLPQNMSMPSFKRRPKLRVHHEDYDDEQDEEDRLADEVDRILAKIGASGQDSLTRKEKRTLEQASRQAKQRRH